MEVECRAQFVSSRKVWKMELNHFIVFRVLGLLLSYCFSGNWVWEMLNEVNLSKCIEEIWGFVEMESLNTNLSLVVLIDRME